MIQEKKEVSIASQNVFYHGFVLGLLADQAEQYEIRSNREVGLDDTM